MLYEYIKSKMIENCQSVIEGISFNVFLNQAEELGKTLNHTKYGILCESELNTAKALLACFYAKKTAVVLSKKYGEVHTKKIIDEINISYLITDRGVKKTNIPDKKEDLSDIAVIMCTSGTTGKPKGAMITYQNLYANVNDIDYYFLLNIQENILISRPLYHCAVLTGEFLISLIKGVNIYFSENSLNPIKLIEEIQQKNINILCGTPTMFHYLCRYVKRLSFPLSIKTIAISGECMSKETAGNIRKCFKQTQIYHVYGLTEASPRVSYLPPELFDDNPTSVGVFLNSLTGKIKDGELLIKGKNVMYGYYGKEKQSEWLHTGDLAEIKNGLLYIKGRKDDLIIRAGMNIYPQEIENILKTDERIKEIFVSGIKTQENSEKIQIQAETDLIEEEVFNVCKKLLPSYMLPDQIIIGKINKTITGKKRRE